MNKIDGAKVLITGGTGSLGTALVKRLLSGVDGTPEAIIIFSRDEKKQADMRSAFPDPRIHYIIGDIRDYSSVTLAVSYADIIFNTAAMKRVESCENFPEQAIQTNCVGACNIIRAIQEHKYPVKVVVNVGSDKGAEPLNVYGMTKGIQESVLLSGNNRCLDTRFVGVRYGNVMGSRGSVILIWQDQLRQNKPITVTDGKMSRFLVTLDQAVDTLLFALNYAMPGEICIPKLPAAFIGDMADVISQGKEVSVTGKGAKEKMHEILITRDEAPYVMDKWHYFVITREIQKILVINGSYVSSDWIISRAELELLFKAQGYV